MLWSVKQEKYQMWQGTPQAMRPAKYRTIKQVSALLETPVATLELWEMLPGWWDGVYGGARRLLGREMPEMLLALVKRAKGGSVPAAKLCFAMLNVHVDKLSIDAKVEGETLLVLLDKRYVDERDEGEEKDAD